MKSAPSESGTFQELLSGLRARFEIEMQVIRVGGIQFDCWKPANPEAILDEETLLASHDELPWQPYWAQAWDAGLGMCQFLSHQRWSGRDVLDLGCGIGATSAWLAAAGARVVCGDNALPGLGFARANTWPWKDRVQVASIDWNQTELGKQFEVIIGADIVYEHCVVEPLDRFFRKHLQPGGSVVLSDPSRPLTVPFLKQFEELGWRLTFSQEELPDLRMPIRIAEMRPAGDDAGSHSPRAGSECR